MTAFIRSVALKNFRSIAECDVELRNLQFLVGPNGAGKSSFLDALAFIRDATRDSLDHAIRNRGGIAEVRRRSRGHPTHFSISVRFRLPSGSTGRYAFRIGAKRGAGYEVQHETCSFDDSSAHFDVKDGRARGSQAVMPPASRDRLYLVAAAGLPEFENVYKSFVQMGFYNLNPFEIAGPQTPQASDVLADHGENTAAVLAELTRLAPERKERIEQYLQAVVPGIVGVNYVSRGRQETLEFRQQVSGATDSWRFDAHTMSDGTLRAVGLLVALFQHASDPWDWAPVIAIEEPEVALHPAATAVLLDALREVSRNTQILVTSHSPDLLDHKEISPETLLAVASLNGNTIIGGPDPASIDAIRERLYTAGELLRMDQLEPEQSSAV